MEPADVETLRAVARQAVDEALRAAPATTLRPGSVVTSDPLRGTAAVILDGDSAELTFQCLVPVPDRGIRVMVLLQPPSSGFVVGYMNGGQMFPTGCAVPFAGQVVPLGWLECNGASYSIEQHPALYQAIGNTYGGTLGGSTFNVPDYRGRAVVSIGGLTTGRVPYPGWDTVGTVGGNVNQTLTVAQLPPHAHGLTQFLLGAGGGGVRVLADGLNFPISQTTDSAGSGAPFDVFQPMIAQLWMIKC